MDPKVFISHASEDKERFVLPFAARLREKGVEAWVDKWEINPGDSLVDKLFEEGLKNAEAVVIVLSKASVSKPWVREELNASIVSRIERQCKIIPVVLDDCEVPECLRSTVRVRISDLNSYDAELSSVLNSIFGHHDKPPLGPPPAFAQSQITLPPGIRRDDGVVLQLLCERAEEHADFGVEPRHIQSAAEAGGIHPAAVRESLDVLRQHGYIEFTAVLQQHIGLVTVTHSGYEQFARGQYHDYDELLKRVALYLVNEADDKPTYTHQIAGVIGCSPLFAQHACDELADHGYIKQRKAPGIGNGSAVYEVRPALRRKLDE